ncbi:hypothetical protein FE257_007507 [Aspergillus nanangensis]|uniref:Uncharacterized protein n=1 Tax=Aspergillus nanangensis TaxID=2582783 RepID=A0AAD4CMC8_ASPNN|nr:hypothetical protein FE257_007507 [Aspergillus nanangensis]
MVPTPFRSFLKRSAAPNGGVIDSNDDANRLSTDSHHSTPLSIRKSSENEPPEYKLSVVDDNGAYIPPSPPEKQSVWRKYPGSSRSSNHRNLVNEDEPFSISRESFDSYRRSFDISARSPVSHNDAMPSRTSLDSRFSHMTSTSAVHVGANKQPLSTEEEHFEDVGLEDEEIKPKKKGIFSRLGDFGDSQGSGSRFHLPGRKRGQSNAESELAPMKSPPAATIGPEVRDA